MFFGKHKPAQLNKSTKAINYFRGDVQFKTVFPQKHKHRQRNKFREKIFRRRGSVLKHGFPKNINPAKQIPPGK